MANVETTLEIVDDPTGTKRGRFSRRDDGHFTYHVEECRDAGTPGHEGDPDDRYWAQERWGGLFDSEETMRRDARRSPDWPLKLADE
jgi:hypothetical protein